MVDNKSLSMNLNLVQIVQPLTVSTGYIYGYTRRDSFNIRVNQNILIGPRFCTVNCLALIVRHQLSYIGLGRKM